ncbi:MAG: hypothetical protein ACOCX5_01700 [Chloroflexota bacterium]
MSEAILYDKTHNIAHTDDTPTEQQPSRRSPIISPTLLLIGLMIYALGVYTYATVRFDGNWGENDTMVLTRAIYGALIDDTVINAETFRYGNGLSYQAISVFVAEITGLDVQTIQVYLYPTLAAIMLPLLAFSAYNALIGHRFIALLATLLLFLQPDFLFVTWRGSHEKVTWAFTLLSLFLLGKILQSHIYNRDARPFVFAFYIGAIAMIFSNGFFSSSMTTALMLSFLLGTIFFAIRRRIHSRLESDDRFRLILQQLMLVTLSIMLLLYLFFFHLYPPARTLLTSFETLIDGLSSLFLGSEEAVGTQMAENYISTTWLSLSIYLLVSSFGWFTLITSFIVWLLGALRMLFKRDLSDLDFTRLFLWALYPTFAIQLVMSVVADQVDTFGSNIQVRLFTPLMLVAIPILAIGIHDIFQRLRQPQLRRTFQVAAAFAVAGFSVLALLKMTNEPLISNQWTFITDQERIAYEWAERHDVDRIWTGMDQRMEMTLAIFDITVDLRKVVFGLQPGKNIRYYLLSDLETTRWTRRAIPLPYLGNEHQIYDNGAARIYHRRPQSIYQ